VIAKLCDTEVNQVILSLNDEPMDASIIEHINNHPEATWVAHENERFKGMTIN